VSRQSGVGRYNKVADRPVVLTQRWEHIVWAHWRVPPEVVAERLPAELSVDCFEGEAWVGLIGFEMRDLRAVVAGRRLPRVGSTASFSEVNVRTYVVGPEGPGVWFDSLDATSRLAVAVAKVAWALPYRFAEIRSELSVGQRGWEIRRPDGTTGALVARVGSPVEPEPLARWLTGRYRLYAPLGRRRSLSAPIRHPEWALYAGELKSWDPGLVHAAGYPVAGPPEHVVAGGPVEVAVGLPTLSRLGRRDPRPGPGATPARPSEPAPRPR